MHVQPESLAEQGLGDDQPVRDRDDGRRAEIEARRGPLRLRARGFRAARRPPWRATGRACALARGRVRSREDAGDLVTCGEPFEDVGAERRGRGDRDRSAQRAPRTGCGLSLASAARRDSSSVRSMISTPSRWSSSCWTTRDAGSSSSNSRARPSRRPLDRDGLRALDGNEHVAEREAAFVVDLRVLRALRDRRIDEHAVLALVHEDEQPPRARRPALPRARRRSPRA